MIDDLKPYPEYVESHLPWLGRVPAHWTKRRLDRLFDMRNEKPEPGDERVTGYLNGRVTLRSNMQGQKIKGVIKDGGWKRIYPGDFAISGMNAHLGGMGVSDSLGKCSPIYLILKALPGTNPYFVSSSVRHIAQIGALKSFVNTIRFNSADFKRDALKLFFLFMPPPDEQAAIVRFLDHANGKIERAIRAKRKLIALLNEQKQAIIHRAVTRGLDPKVKLKPSGIPWLGDVPQHWEVRRLRTIVYRIDQGISPQATGFLAQGNSWGVLKSGCVNHGVFRQTEHKQLPSGFVADPSIVVKVGDVLVSRACGSPKLVGSVGRVQTLDYQLILSDKTFRPVFRPFVCVDFIVYAMNAPYYRTQVEQAISGAEGMANNLPLSELRSVILAVPPLMEASAIALWVQDELAHLIIAISRTEREINLLHEYRARLTADVVTGKLDVRGAVKNLPAEAEELPTTDELIDEEIDDEVPEEVEA